MNKRAIMIFPEFKNMNIINNIRKKIRLFRDLIEEFRE